MDREILQRAGIDYEAGLARFLGDKELYAAVLEAFAKDDVVERARSAYGSRDARALLAAVHEAKGSGGNAGMDEAYRTADRLVRLLRGGPYTGDELAEAYREFEAAYLSAQATARAALGQHIPRGELA